LLQPPVQFPLPPRWRQRLGIAKGEPVRVQGSGHTVAYSRLDR
jgi:hypothetical protein